MGTKRNPGAFDCYAQASDDEPIFVLLARDANAPEAVAHWAETYRAKKLFLGQWDQSAAEKYNEALSCSIAMKAWRSERDAKV